MKEYALYKGEDILSIGTINEIAKEMGVSEGIVKHYITNAYKRKKIKEFKDERILVCLDD